MRFFGVAALLVAGGIAAVRGERAVQLIAVGVVVAVLILMVVVRRRRRRIRDWRDAEDAAARWLRRAGCRRVALTGGSADGGLDVITAGWAVQVKHTSKRVGRPAVQQLVGAALAIDRAPALFSTSGFSKPGIEYADAHDVALLEMDLAGNATRLNRPARRVGTRTRRVLRR